MTQSDPIKVWEEPESICNIQLHSPPGNIIDRNTIRATRDAVRGLGPEIRLIVFSGAGSHFSYGASIQEHEGEQIAGLLADFHALLNELADAAIPCLAMVQGRCTGGGLELAAYCNFVFADTSALFSLPEVSLGLFPPSASVILPAKLGQSWADWLITTGMEMEAEEAMQIGLVHSLHDSGQLPVAVSEFLNDRILNKSASALRYANRACREDFNRNLKQACKRLEALYLDELMQTDDAREGIRAFLEKRKPEWKHR